MMTQFGEPLTRRCTVEGIYDSNNKDYDAHYAFISLESARQLSSTATVTAASRSGSMTWRKRIT